MLLLKLGITGKFQLAVWFLSMGYAIMGTTCIYLSKNTLVSELGINFINVYCCSGKTLCDYLETLPREWISEDLIEALREKGVHLSPTV